MKKLRVGVALDMSEVDKQLQNYKPKNKIDIDVGVNIEELDKAVTKIEGTLSKTKTISLLDNNATVREVTKTIDAYGKLTTEIKKWSKVTGERISHTKTTEQKGFAQMQKDIADFQGYLDNMTRKADSPELTTFLQNVRAEVDKLDPSKILETSTRLEQLEQLTKQRSVEIKDAVKYNEQLAQSEAKTWAEIKKTEKAIYDYIQTLDQMIAKANKADNLELAEFLEEMRYNLQMIDYTKVEMATNTLEDYKQMAKMASIEIEPLIKQNEELANSMGKVNEKSRENTKKRDRSQEIAQTQAMNKALEEEYKQYQKNATALSEYQRELERMISTARQQGKIYLAEELEKIVESSKKIDPRNLETFGDEMRELKNSVKDAKVELSNIEKGMDAIAKEAEQSEKAVNDFVNKLEIMIRRAETMERTTVANELKEIKRNAETLNPNNIVETAQALERLKHEADYANANMQKLKFSFQETFAGKLITKGLDIGMDVIADSFRQGLTTFVDIDSAMRDLRKVSSSTAEELEQFRNIASDIAVSVGASSVEVIKATEYYSKLGYAVEEASKRAELATIFKNIADFSSIDSASEALITIQKGFSDIADTEADMLRIMDVANEVGNNFTSTSEDIAEGLRRSGNALSEANNTYEQSVGIFVAANSSIQQADKVGNAIKSIAMRLRGMETELDKTGLPISKLRDKIKEVTAEAGQAVDIMSDDNTFKSTYQILNELSGVWDKLTDSQRAFLQEQIAGKQQGNVFAGIMENMTEGVQAYETALRSSGSAMKEQEIYMDSVEGKINKLKEAVMGVWTDFLETDAVKGMLDDLSVAVEDAGKGFKGFAEIGIELAEVLVKALGGIGDVLSTLTEGIGGTETAFLLLGTAMSLFYGKKLTTFITDIWGCVKGVNALEIASVGASTALNTLKTAFLTNPFAWITIAITAFSWLIGKINESKEAARQLNKEFIENDYNGTIGSAEELLSKYEEIYAELGTLKKGTEEYTQKEQELHSVIDQLTGIYPNLNQAIVENEGHKRLNIEATKELLETEKELAKIKALDVIGEGGGTLNDLETLVGKTKALKSGLEEGLKTSQEYFDKTGVSGYLADTLEKDSQALQDNIDKMMAKREAYILLDDNTGKYGDAIAILTEGLEDLGYTFEDTTDTTGQLNEELKKIADTAGDGTEAMTEFYRSMQDWNMDGSLDEADEALRLIMQDATSAQEAVQALSKEFSSYEQPIQVSAEAMQQLNEQGYINGELYEKIIKSGDVRLIAGLWLEGAEAEQYYIDLNKDLVEGVEDVGDAAVVAAAEEMGILEENETAYAQLMEARKVAHEQAKQDAITLANESKDEQIRIKQQEIEEKYRYDIQHAENTAVADELRKQQAQETADAIAQIEAETNKTIEDINNGNIDVLKTQLDQQITDVQDANAKKQEAYKQDEQAHEQAQLNKTKKEQAFVNDSTRRYSSYVSGANTAYQTDVSNFQSAISQKISALVGFQNALSNAVGAVNNFNNMSIRSFSTGGGSTGGHVAMLQSLDDSEFNAVAPMSADAVAPMSEGGEGGEGDGVAPLAIPGGVQNSAGNFVGSTLGNVRGEITSFTKATEQLTKATNKLTSSTKASASASKSNASAKEKESKEIEIEYDRYYKLNDVLDDYDNLLKRVEDTKDEAVGGDYYEAIKKENEIIARKTQVLRQLLQEQQAELSETRATLSANGFLFDSYGNLINSQEKLQELVGWANAGDDDRKEHVKDLEDMVDLYTKLANDSIPDTEDAIRDLNKELNEKAVDSLIDLREKLVDALKQERESQKEAEIGILDARIEELRKQIDELNDEEGDRLTKRAKLEAELEKWRRDDSAFSTKKQQELQKELDELNREIREDELNNQIEEIEKTKETVEQNYDNMLSEKELYEEANNLISQGKTEEMLALLEAYGEDYKNIGVLWGQNLSDAFMEEIKTALEALEYLKGESNKFTNDVNPSTPPPQASTPSTPAPAPAPTTKPVSIGSRVKVTDVGAGIYVDSYTSQSSGTWRGANVSTSDTMYVYNMRGDKVALARSQGGVPIGWIDKKKVKAFDTGGYTGEFQGGQLAMLHSKERVLSAQQTQSFEKLVGMLGDLVENPILQLSQYMKGMSNPMSQVNTNIEINNNFTVTNNTPFDQDRQDNNISQLMAKELRRFGKITRK